MITSKLVDDLHPNKGRKRECEGRLDDHPCLQGRGFSSFDDCKARARQRERKKEREREIEEQRWCQKVVHRGRMERQRRKHLLRE